MKSKHKESSWLLQLSLCMMVMAAAHIIAHFIPPSHFWGGSLGFVTAGAWFLMLSVFEHRMIHKLKSGRWTRTWLRVVFYIFTLPPFSLISDAIKPGHH